MFAYCTLPQLLYYYYALILGSITIAFIIMTMHDIVFSMNIAGDDECSRARCITFDAADPYPYDERPPVMYGHFRLVPRVSVHDRYYCIQCRNKLRQIQCINNHTSYISWVSAVVKTNNSILRKTSLKWGLAGNSWRRLHRTGDVGEMLCMTYSP